MEILVILVVLILIIAALVTYSLSSAAKIASVVQHVWDSVMNVLDRKSDK